MSNPFDLNEVVDDGNRQMGVKKANPYLVKVFSWKQGRENKTHV